jgi:hypothetical protein
MKTLIMILLIFTFTRGSALALYYTVQGDDPPYVANPIPDILVPEDFGAFTASQNLNQVFIDPNGDLLYFVVDWFSNHNIMIAGISDTLGLETLPNKFGKDTVVIAATNQNGTARDTFMVTVISVNDIPEFVNLPGFFWFRSDSVLSINFWQHVNDIETPDNLLVYEFSANNPNLLIFFNTSNGILALSTTSGWSGNTDLYIKVTDEEGAYIVTTIPVVVDPTTGIKEGEDHLPVDYYLSQNFPNPFNPTTTIKFEIPERSFVALKVYDVLGNEIATLINEEKPAGSYEITFDGSDLTSGIYFYKIQAGSFVEIKKMVLLK